MTLPFHRVPQRVFEEPGDGAVVGVTPTRAILYESKRVALRRLTVEDKDEFIHLARVSSGFLHPWVYLPDTSAKFDKYIQRFDGQRAECTVVCTRHSGAITGSISINDIIRGSHQRASVGYNAFAPTAGRGYMSEGFSLIFRFAFKDLGLHRLEADIEPDNEISRRFAERIGFRREGYSPGLICIDGSWKDFERWAISSEMIASQQRPELER